MSVHFPQGADTFLYKQMATPLSSGLLPMSFGGWVKYKTDQGIVRVGGCGNSFGNYHAIARLSGKDTEYRAYTTGADGLVKGILKPASDTWIYIGISRTSDTIGHIYVKTDLGKSYVLDSAILGVWSADEIQKIIFGSTDINFVGGGANAQQDLMLAEWGLWDSVLSETDFDDLANGATPASKGALHHWFIDDAAEQLNDQVGAENLNYYDTATTTINTGSVPPVYNADHPIVVSGAKVVIPIIIDSSNTPHPDIVGVKYVISSGLGSDALTVEYSGTANIVGGEITVDTPNHDIGDKLVYQHDIPDGDIHGALTEFAYGGVTVQ